MSLYLLYLQVGVSFLAGLVFAILLIPLNRYVCIKVHGWLQSLSFMD